MTNRGQIRPKIKNLLFPPVPNSLISTTKASGGFLQRAIYAATGKSAAKIFETVTSLNAILGQSVESRGGIVVNGAPREGINGGGLQYTPEGVH